MKIHTHVRYGLRSLCDIAYHGKGTIVQVSSISQRQQISARYIETIFQKLNKAGIVKGIRGPAGGYYLGRRPEEITIGDVIRAVDGSNIDLVPCSGNKKSHRRACARFGGCAISDIWNNASRTLNDYFDSVTLEDICIEMRTREDEVSPISLIAL